MDNLLLEPCPICDGEAKLQTSGNFCRIVCTDCLLKSDTFDNQESLKSYWNHRPNKKKLKKENWVLTQQLNILISAIQTDIRKDGTNYRLEEALNKLQSV